MSHAELPGALREYVGLLEPGDPVELDGIRFYPLLRPDTPPETPVALLEDVDEGGLQVQETSQVSELVVVNQTDQHVLLLEGDIITGGRQNRVINTTFVVQPHATTALPTSCVEQGRWGADMGHFKSSGHSVSPKVRSKLKRSVTQTACSTRGMSHASNQGEVWTSTSETISHNDGQTSTSDHMSAYAAKRQELEEKAKRLREAIQTEGMVGLAVTHTDGSAVVESFATTRIARKVLERIVQAHLLAARGEREHGRVGELLSDVREAAGMTLPGRAGVGEEVRLKRDRMSASAYVFSGATLHLSADWEEEAAPPTEAAA